ncbi:MAG: hypothetical protein F9K19_18865 [Rhizobiaceae bacterium]|nr:MAG: hypothetical protein F9K19_18865 [Rhizobiaceae bacterium]CAG0949017.1 hypothetical protein RHIZO_00073 [Rhizobiaceae bacterium]
MSAVTVGAEGFVVEAEVIATAFGLAPAEVRARMRDGAITSRCETSVDADTGRYRLTFQHAGRSLRLTVDSDGNILSRATFDRGANRTARSAPG